MPLTREYKTTPGTIAVTTAIGTTAEVDISAYAMGNVWPATAATLTLWVAPSPGGTYAALTDQNDVAVQMVFAAATSQPIPPEAFGAGALKFVGGASETITVSLKG